MSGQIIKQAGEHMEILSGEAIFHSKGKKGFVLDAAQQISIKAVNKTKLLNYAPVELQPVNTTYVYMGIFFDGTGNNMFNTDLKVNHGSKAKMSYDANYSNIARLFCRYKNTPEVGAEKKIAYYVPVYVQGIGTKKGIEDTENIIANVFGTSSEGVVNKVEQSYKENIAGRFDYYNVPIGNITKLTIDLFGFSRGAAAARHFANVITDAQKYLVVLKAWELKVNAIKEHNAWVDDTNKAATSYAKAHNNKEVYGGNNYKQVPVIDNNNVVSKQLPLKKLPLPAAPVADAFTHALWPNASTKTLPKEININFIGLFDTVTAALSKQELEAINENISPIKLELNPNVKIKFEPGIFSSILYLIIPFWPIKLSWKAYKLYRAFVEIQNATLNNNNDPIRINLSQVSFNSGLHLTAGNEYRNNFRLNLCDSIPATVLPGVHSDIGGGYDRLEMTDDFALSPFYKAFTPNFTFEYISLTEGFTKCDIQRRLLIKEGFYNESELEIVFVDEQGSLNDYINDLTSHLLSPLIYVIYLQLRTVVNKKKGIGRKITTDYSLIPFEIMLRKASDNHVPFVPFEEVVFSDEKKLEPKDYEPMGVDKLAKFNYFKSMLVNHHCNVDHKQELLISSNDYARLLHDFLHRSSEFHPLEMIDLLKDYSTKSLPVYTNEPTEDGYRIIYNENGLIAPDNGYIKSLKVLRTKYMDKIMQEINYERKGREAEIEKIEAAQKEAREKARNEELMKIINSPENQKELKKIIEEANKYWGGDKKTDFFYGD